MKDVFSTELGKRIYSDAVRAIDDYGMLEHIKKGVLIGFSGGADSVMLLHLLRKIKSTVCDFPLIAVHINHMIRGDEAMRDESFSQSVCQELGVEFKSIRINVPEIAGEEGIGLEEAARNARYSAFNRFIDSNEQFSTIAVAHNATDNLETVIFNMMRGSGLSGIAGIPPVRENIIRPLIYSSKQDITAALDKAGISYAVDSTNADSQYKRNYIRHEIIPRLSEISSDPVSAATRMCRNLRADSEYINGVADKLLEENLKDGCLPARLLADLPGAVFYRVLLKMIPDGVKEKPEQTHVDAIYGLLKGENFSYSLPGKIKFTMENGICRIGNDIIEHAPDYFITLGYGVNEIPAYSTVAIVSDDKTFKSYSNIYKISIQAQIPSDIISNGLSLRPKRDGDSYIYGGMTRRLKKIFNDRKIPPSKRQHVPIVVDNDGIVWVPGFNVRDTEKADKVAYVAFAEPISPNDAKKPIYFKAER